MSARRIRILEQLFLSNEREEFAARAASWVVDEPRLFDHITCDVLQDEFLEFAREALTLCTPRTQGFLYIATNPANRISTYKVGVTAKSPAVRMKSLKSAGVQGRLILLDAYEVPARYKAETLAHQALALKFERDGEFFLAPWAEVSAEVRQACTKVTSGLSPYIAGWGRDT